MIGDRELRLMVTGITGQVGWELIRALRPLGKVIGADRHAMDLSDPDSIRREIREAKPDVLVNPAAWTAVDRAETEPEAASAINALAPAVIAEECRRIGALMVHFSTDFVFDGDKHSAWSEDDPPKPLNVYGQTKLEGENAVRAIGGRHLILRTGWVYSLRGTNFLRTIVRLARSGKALRIIDDQCGSPTAASALADLTAQVVSRHFAAERFGALNGIYHATCSGHTTWYGFANAVLRKLVARPTLREEFRIDRHPTLEAIPAIEYPLPAARPKNSILSLRKLKADWGLVMPAWENALDDVLRDA